MEIVSAVGAATLAKRVSLLPVNVMLHSQLSAVIMFVDSFAAGTVYGSIRIHRYIHISKYVCTYVMQYNPVTKICTIPTIYLS